MVGFDTIVQTVLIFLGAGAVFGLLFFLINYLEKEFGGFPLFFKAARVFLVVCAVLVLIGFIMGLMGTPLIRWPGR